MGWTSSQGCTASAKVLPVRAKLTAVQRLCHRAAVLYLVFFAGLCGGFVAAQQLYLWTESARVQSAALAVRPVLPTPQAVQTAQPDQSDAHVMSCTPGLKGRVALLRTGSENMLAGAACAPCAPKCSTLSHAAPDIIQL